jgi:hypothetical protein
MAEPEKNSYVITVFLHDVQKKDALQCARIFENTARLGMDSGKIGDVMVITGHVKDVAPEFTSSENSA